MNVTGKSYPSLKDNSDYTSIINRRHYERLRALLTDAEEKGARKIVIKPDGEQILDDAHRMPPTLLIDVRPDMKVMQEEIFGPILPMMTYKTLDDAIDYVNQRPSACVVLLRSRSRACPRCTPAHHFRRRGRERHRAPLPDR